MLLEFPRPEHIVCSDAPFTIAFRPGVNSFNKLPEFDKSWGVQLGFSKRREIHN